MSSTSVVLDLGLCNAFSFCSKLRELMLTTLSAVNVTSLHTALKMSEVLKEITYRSEELSSSAQVRG